MATKGFRERYLEVLSQEYDEISYDTALERVDLARKNGQITDVMYQKGLHLLYELQDMCGTKEGVVTYQDMLRELYESIYVDVIQERFSHLLEDEIRGVKKSQRLNYYLLESFDRYRNLMTIGDDDSKYTMSEIVDAGIDMELVKNVYRTTNYICLPKDVVEYVAGYGLENESGIEMC